MKTEHEDLGGFHLEFEFFDGDNAYVNAVLDEEPSDGLIGRCNAFVREMAENFAYAMNWDNFSEEKWTAYTDEVNWWDADGNELEDDEEGRECVRVIQCTVRR